MTKSLNQPLVQFVPGPGKSLPRWSYGWGQDMNGYRVVMYAPSGYDHSVLMTLDRGKLKPRFREHGPAHIHVIHMQTGRESRFELVQGISPTDNGVRLIAPREEEDERRTRGTQPPKPLTEAQTAFITPKFGPELVQQFIQLWQEAYAESSMSAQVRRQSHIAPHCTEQQAFYPSGAHYMDVTDTETTKTARFNFDDYMAHMKLQQRGR